MSDESPLGPVGKAKRQSRIDAEIERIRRSPEPTRDKMTAGDWLDGDKVRQKFNNFQSSCQ